MAYAYDSEITAWPSMLPSGPFTDVSVEQFDATAARIASEAGAVMVSVEYRLAPEHPFPAELEDCYAARVWTAKSRDTTDVSPYAAPVRAENLAGLPPAFISAAGTTRSSTRTSTTSNASPTLTSPPNSPSTQGCCTDSPPLNPR